MVHRLEMLVHNHFLEQFIIDFYSCTEALGSWSLSCYAWIAWFMVVVGFITPLSGIIAFTVTHHSTIIPQSFHN